MKALKIAGAILAVLLGVCILSGMYWFYLSPDRENHWVFARSGGRVAYFDLMGTVVDQYGNPVPNYDVAFALYPGGITPKRRELSTTTDNEGKFQYHSRPLKAMAVIVGGRTVCDNDGQRYAQDADMGGYFVYQGKGEWLWRHDPGDPWKKHEPNTAFVYRIGHIGTPERLIQFTCNRVGAVPLSDDHTTRVNILTGKEEAVDCGECDFELRVHNAETASSVDGEKMTVELIGLNGAASQVAGDSFWPEAPPDGYKSRLILQSEPHAPLWPVGIAANLYFQSRNGRVFGKMTVEISPSGLHGPKRSLSCSIDVTANPRGSRNLYSGGSASYQWPLRLPVTLPFDENLPLVNQTRIWSYKDPSRENTLIVEGEMGAIEPGMELEIVNHKGTGSEPGRPKKWRITGKSNPDGGFQVSLDGLEGDWLTVRIQRPLTQPRTDPPDDHILEIIPRWRRTDKGKR